MVDCQQKLSIKNIRAVSSAIRSISQYQNTILEISLMGSYSAILFQQFDKRGCKMTFKETQYSLIKYINKFNQCPTMIHLNQWEYKNCNKK